MICDNCVVPIDHTIIKANIYESKLQIELDTEIKTYICCVYIKYHEHSPFRAGSLTCVKLSPYDIFKPRKRPTRLINVNMYIYLCFIIICMFLSNIEESIELSLPSSICAAYSEASFSIPFISPEGITSKVSPKMINVLR